MYKIAKIGAIFLGAVAVLLWILLFSTANVDDINNAPMNWLFVLAYLLIGFTALSAVVSGAKNIVSNPKALKKTLIYTGAFIVIVGLAYAFAGGEGIEKWISAGLIALYILVLVAVAALIASNVKNALIK